MNYVLSDETPIASAAGGLVVQAGVHEFCLRDNVPQGFHYVAQGGYRSEWLRARRRLYSAHFMVFDLRHVLPGISTELRGNLERDVPGVVTFTARRTWQRSADLYSEIASHAVAIAEPLDSFPPRLRQVLI